MKKADKPNKIFSGKEVKCFYCPHLAETKDHIIPRVVARAVPHNWVPSCKLCNTTRGCVPQEDFIKFMKFVHSKGILYHDISKPRRRKMRVEFYHNTGIRIGLDPNFYNYYATEESISTQSPLAIS